VLTQAARANVLLTAVIFAACAATAASAQSQPGSSPKPTAPPSGPTKTVVGCLAGYDGHYTLGTSSDVLYLLVGDSALFKRYNARLVQATGTVSEPPPHDSMRKHELSKQPPTLTVSKLKKVADGCD
jgi:hypothetical protein